MNRRQILLSGVGLLLPAYAKAGDYLFGVDRPSEGGYLFGLPKETPNEDGEAPSDPGEDPPDEALTDRRRNRILAVTDAGCGPCDRLKEESFKALREVGWSIGSSDRKIIQILDSADASRLGYGVDSIPTLILLRNEKEVERQVGFQTAGEISRWYNDFVEAKKSESRVARVRASFGSTSYDYPRWTYSGSNLAAHCINVHRYSRAAVRGLSFGQLVSLHSRAHNTPGAGYNPGSRGRYTDTESNWRPTYKTRVG